MKKNHLIGLIAALVISDIAAIECREHIDHARYALCLTNGGKEEMCTSIAWTPAFQKCYVGVVNEFLGL